MNVVQEIQRINDRELKLGIAGTSASWHEEYARSAWVYVGGLAYSLSEGDVLCIFSQWGEIEDMHLVRDDDTGKSKGFAFIKYCDQRSTALAVDNFNGAKVLGRTIRCDHCQDYHEEQAKDPANLPDHVTRKLSEKELDKKELERQEQAKFRSTTSKWSDSGSSFVVEPYRCAFNVEKTGTPAGALPAVREMQKKQRENEKEKAAFDAKEGEETSAASAKRAVKSAEV